MCTSKYTHSAAVAMLGVETAEVKQSIKGYGGLEERFTFLCVKELG